MLNLWSARKILSGKRVPYVKQDYQGISQLGVLAVLEDVLELELALEVAQHD